MIGKKYLLYLTDGVANFYLSQSSYCREFFPIAINRFKHNSSNKFYIKTKECIDSYQGSFIILQINWFPVDNFWHLLKDYDVVYSNTAIDRGYKLFKRKY